MNRKPRRAGAVARGPAGWRAALLALALPAAAAAAAPAGGLPPLPATIRADQPLVVGFPVTEARFVRVVIARSSSGQPCLDELEVRGPDGEANLALASTGAKATASSCLAGYPIHQVAHLNDGRFGNDHSWIAAGAAGEWAQVELPARRPVYQVVVSRDRNGAFFDRVPVEFEVRVSDDGADWRAVRAVKVTAIGPGTPIYAGPCQLSERPTWDQLLAYAFECERHTWRKISKDDHLSPLATERAARPGGPPYWGRIARMDHLERTLVLLEEMIGRLAPEGVDVREACAQLAGFRQRQAQLAEDAAAAPAAADRLHHDARLAKRGLMFRDPGLTGLGRVLFVKRHPYHASHNYSDVLDSEFRAGGGVFVLRVPRRDGCWRPEEAEFECLFDASAGIARDPVADFDAGRVWFAFRPDRSPRPEWSPYWHLMAVGADGSGLRQLTDGPYHDYYPCPLPDGGLAFVSTRCRARFLCWRPQAFVLFRMEMDGSNIRPLSFANLSEWTPRVTSDGRILWTRSEYIDKGADFGHTLWTIRPDGTHPALVFGNNTPNCYINAAEVPGSGELLCTIFSHGGDHNGPVGLIDPASGPFDSTAVTNITPDIRPHYNMNWPRFECFRDPTPLSRDYFLVSHAPADRFGLYVIDRYGNRELLYLDPEIGSMSPTPLRPVARPPVLSPVAPGAVDPSAGEMMLADVYQGLGPAVPRGSVKWLRICEEVRAGLDELPDGQLRADHPVFQDWYATPVHKVSGPAGWPSYVAKASFGLVPVEPDGSASFLVPAGKVFYFQALDWDFNEVQRMRSVMQVQAGERRSCIGCHENRQSAPPPLLAIAARRRPAPPQPEPWGTGPFSYERTVQPVWDAHCIRCHDAADKGGINLTGTLDADKVPASYRTLIEGGWVHYFDCRYNLRHAKAEPLGFGTVKSRLCGLLERGHEDVRLAGEEMRAVKCWIDLNCPLWPDYVNRPERAVAGGR